MLLPVSVCFLGLLHVVKHCAMDAFLMYLSHSSYINHDASNNDGDLILVSMKESGRSYRCDLLICYRTQEIGFCTEWTQKICGK